MRDDRTVVANRRLLEFHARGPTNEERASPMLWTNTKVARSQSVGRRPEPGVDARTAGRLPRASVGRAAVLVEPQRFEVREGERPSAQGLGYEPRVSFDDGLRELAEWLADQTAEDNVSDASRELEARGLTMGGGAA